MDLIAEDQRVSAGIEGSRRIVCEHLCRVPTIQLDNESAGYPTADTGDVMDGAAAEVANIRKTAIAEPSRV